MQEAPTTTRPEQHKGTLEQPKGLDPQNTTMEQCNNAIKKIFGLKQHERVFSYERSFVLGPSGYKAVALDENYDGALTPAMLQELADVLRTIKAPIILSEDKHTIHHTPPKQGTPTPKIHDRLTLNIYPFESKIPHVTHDGFHKTEVKSVEELLAEALNILAKTKGVDISSVSPSRAG